MGPMKLKQLEQYLQQIEGFDNPKILLGEVEFSITKHTLIKLILPFLSQSSTPPGRTLPPACCTPSPPPSTTSRTGLWRTSGAGAGCSPSAASCSGPAPSRASMWTPTLWSSSKRILQVGSCFRFQGTRLTKFVFCADFEIDNIDLVNADIGTLGDGSWDNKFEVVIMNPPFGTKHNKGLDVKFLQTGISMASRSVYSLHKTSTREHILKKAADWGVSAQVLAELRYDLPNTYKHHKKSSVDIHVDFIRFSKSPNST